MQKSKISLDLQATAPGCLVTVFLDSQPIATVAVDQQTTTVAHEFDDVEGQHVLEIALVGKTSAHTIVDDTGNIIDDLLINVSNICIEEINIDTLVWNLSQYHHDQNGTSVMGIDRFYGTMGCNGIVKLNFSTPIYLWLLENM